VALVVSVQLAQAARIRFFQALLQQAAAQVVEQTSD
jgi:hypothetical protein